jgi:D-3-phosphoglycerate dehydrogenase
VFEPEPLAGDHPFHAIPNLFLTPHIAGGTDESGRRMSAESAEETLRILRGTQTLALAGSQIREGYLARHVGIFLQETAR